MGSGFATVSKEVSATPLKERIARFRLSSLVTINLGQIEMAEADRAID